MSTKPKFLATACLCVLLAGCATYGRPLPEVAPEINSTLYLGPTLIEPGDMVDLRVADKAEWNQLVVVRMDGRATFPLIGEIRTAGLTLSELKAVLDERYTRELTRGGTVTLNLGNPDLQGREGTAGVVVSGEVTTPGMITLNGERITLIEALGRAGGQLKATALLGNTLLVRRSPHSGQYTSWNIDAREIYWGRCDPIYLQRHDMIFVPNTPIDDVNIWIDQYINKMVPVGITPFVLGIVVAQ